MLILLTAAFLTGTIVPVQTAANARLRLATGSLPAVVLISFAVSFAALLFISLACGIAVLPTAAQAQAIPWWGWLGGIIALFTISASTFLFKTLGQLQTTILPLLGQLLFSLVIDNFGLFGSVQIPFSTTRAAAIALILFGIALAIVLPAIADPAPAAVANSRRRRRLLNGKYRRYLRHTGHAAAIRRALQPSPSASPLWQCLPVAL